MVPKLVRFCLPTSSDGEPLVLCKVGYTAHPSAEAPQREHRAFAGYVRVLVENLFRLANEEEEVHLLVLHEYTVGAYV